MPVTPDAPTTFQQVAERELDYIARRRAVESSTSEDIEASKTTIRNDLVGLAMSGGGIRAATTMLGVTQALARLGVLPLVDYISSVSGGGYLASGLSALLSLNHTGVTQPGDDGQYQFRDRADAAYSTRWGTFPFNPETARGREQVSHLRTHGSFLVARQGLLSRDTLRSVGILLMGASYHVAIVLLAIVLMASLYMGVGRVLVPRLDERLREPAVSVMVRPTSVALSPGHIQPSSVQIEAALISQTMLGRLRHKFDVEWQDLLAAASDARSRQAFGWAVGGGVGLSVVAFAWIWWRRLRRRRPPPEAGESVEDTFERHVVGQSLAWFVAGSLALVVVVRVYVWSQPLSTAPLFLPLAVCAGAGFTNVVLLVLATFSFSTTGQSIWDRQSRSLTGAYKALVTYAAAMTLLLALLPILIYTCAEIGPWTALIAVVSALVGRLALARAAGTSLLKIPFSEAIRQSVLAVAVWLFVISIVVLFLGALVAYDQPASMVWWVAAGTVGLLAILASVDLNRMSLHYFYRDRLMETYLRTEAPAPDHTLRTCADTMDMHLRSLHGEWPANSAVGSTAPYLLINCALNLTASRDLTRRNRKSGHFLFSKYYCGSDQTGYRPTEAYRQGKTQLARALTISGAATSAAMGYRTYFAQAFMMVLFNLRLGFWMENPKRPESLDRHEGWAIWPWWLAREITSSTHERTRLVNLSDGGHTGDNLGIYPLLARRCHVIIAYDAECDPGLSFGSFTGALRQAYVDFGIEVDINLSMLRPHPKTGLSREQSAVGRIRYPERDRPLGWFIYMKSTLTGHEPEPILNYKTQAATFPHESTVDQFFSDDQFESYRALGEHIATKTFGAPGAFPRHTP